MPTSTHPPLPVDRVTLAGYLPAEPGNTTVSSLKAAIARLDELSVSERGRIDKADEADRQIVLELCAAAVEGQPVSSIVGRSSAGDRATISHRLMLLEHARSRCMHQLTVAERTDPAHLGWLTETQQITDEWSRLMGIEDAGDRFTALTRFAAVHRRTDPSPD